MIDTVAELEDESLRLQVHGVHGLTQDVPSAALNRSAKLLPRSHLMITVRAGVLINSHYYI